MWELQDFTRVRRWYALHLVLCVTFFIASLIINAFQFLLFFTIRPFDKALFRQINYYLIYSIMAQILFLSEWWSGSEVRVYTDPEDMKKWGTEHSLIIMNHTYEVDWLMGWMVADRSGVLGAAKVFVKKMMQYVPTIGWAWRCSDIIFLSRNWQQDKSVMQDQIKEFYDYPYPIWMLLFAEGTRFTKQKHAASMEFARERGLKELKRHLIPRTRGFIQCAQSLKGHFPVIYDVTVGFNTKEGADPTMLNMLQGRRVVGEMYVRRLPLDEVPVGDDESTSRYLHQLYQTKDELLDSYCRTGSFTQLNSMPSYPAVKLQRRYCSLLNVVFWVALCVWGGVRVLSSASLLLRCVAALVFIMAYVGLYKLIGLTKITKGSEYGSSSPSSHSPPGSSPVGAPSPPATSAHSSKQE